MLEIFILRILTRQQPLELFRTWKGSYVTRQDVVCAALHVPPIGRDIRSNNSSRCCCLYRHCPRLNVLLELQSNVAIVERSKSTWPTSFPSWTWRRRPPTTAGCSRSCGS